MATFRTRLTDLEVHNWFPPTQPLNQELIIGATGVYTVSIFGRSVGYYLEVDGGERLNEIELGRPVQASGRSEDGETVQTVVMEATSTGDPAMFKGPYDPAQHGSPDGEAAPSDLAIPSGEDAETRCYSFSNPSSINGPFGTIEISVAASGSVSGSMTVQTLWGTGTTTNLSLHGQCSGTTTHDCDLVGSGTVSHWPDPPKHVHLDVQLSLDANWSEGTMTVYGMPTKVLLTDCPD